MFSPSEHFRPLIKLSCYLLLPITHLFSPSLPLLSLSLPRNISCGFWCACKYTCWPSEISTESGPFKPIQIICMTKIEVDFRASLCSTRFKKYTLYISNPLFKKTHTHTPFTFRKTISLLFTQEDDSFPKLFIFFKLLNLSHNKIALTQSCCKYLGFAWNI